MNFVWFILIGVVVGVLSSILTKKTDLGSFGNILVCIIGALTGDFFIKSLGYDSQIGTVGSLIFASVSALFFLFLMRKISNSF